MPAEAVSFRLASGESVQAPLRRCARARRVRIRLEAGALSISAPAGPTFSEIEKMAAAFLPWVEKIAGKGLLAPAERSLPESIVLPGAGLEFSVRMDSSPKEAPAAGATLKCRGNAIVIYGEDLALAQKSLQLFCRRLAGIHLPPFLAALAASAGFPSFPLTIRDQKSRWGSFSRRDGGRISLNWRALLLTRPLLEHLCWHELCHSRQPNHSAAFHKELASHSPDQARLEKALSQAWRALPAWTFPL